MVLELQSLIQERNLIAANNKSCSIYYNTNFHYHKMSLACCHCHPIFRVNKISKRMPSKRSMILAHSIVKAPLEIVGALPFCICTAFPLYCYTITLIKTIT